MQVLVFGDNPEIQAKQCFKQFKAYKESDWLYEGVLMRSDLSIEEAINKITVSPKMMPLVIVDNGHLIDKTKARFSDKTWLMALTSLMESAYPEGKVHCYTCD